MDTNRVIVLTDPALAEIAVARATRAGGVAPRVITWPGSDAVKAAVEGGAVAVVTCRPGEAPGALRALLELGMRPIPALAIDGGPEVPRVSSSTLDLLADPGLNDLEVPVPAVENDAARRRLWDQLREVAAEERHHLVEVDGGPADGWAALAAGAAGVLAGRRAAGDRRWRADLDG